MFKNALFGLLAAGFLSFSQTPAVAQGNVNLSDVAQVALIPGWRTERGTHMAALQIILAPGWKTYWRAPGDAGIPPQFDWLGSGNLSSVTFHWPTPSVFDLNGMQTLAYKDVVVIPIELTPGPDHSGPITLRGRMDFGVCEEICVPMSVKITADLTNSGARVATIDQALANQPRPAIAAGVGSVTCAIEPISDGLQLTASIEIPALGGHEIAVVELPDRSIWISEATTQRTGKTLSATAEMVPPNGQPFSLARSDIRITVIGNNGGVDIQGCSAG